ncbi:MAG: hypothetical protein GX605_00540 [Chloroflexi bacterium]|nr:hypothetical protein [Chloroflexota bacterium]
MTQRMSRRTWLRRASLLMASLLLEACTPNTPTPTTVSPTGTRRPTWTPTATPKPRRPTRVPTGTATATGTPTATQTAKPRVTRAPSHTPTPTATPFPPGPPTKLGLFVTRNDPRIFDLVRTKNVALVKTLEYDPNFVADLKNLSPETILVARPHLPQLDLDHLQDPVGHARQVVEGLLPIAAERRRRQAIDAWEAYNEPVTVDAGQMRRLAEFEAERARLLAAEGLRAVVGNFATGNPPLELWEAFRPALEAVQSHGGYLGLHEYSAPLITYGANRDLLFPYPRPEEEGWLTLRYRKVYRQFLIPWGLQVPLLLTECGVDGLVGDRPGPAGKGWQDFVGYWEELGLGPDGAGNYVEQLAWYDAGLQQDAYAHGAAIFAAAASPGWESYEVLDKPMPFLMQYFSVHPAR